MKLIKPSYEIITPIDDPEEVKRLLRTLEKVARTCYKSEDKITEGSAEKMIKGLLSKKHEAMIEFFDIIVKFTCDRGVSHEIVRHRLASYAQESTRFCNYSKDKFDHGITIIDIDDVFKLQIGKELTHPFNGTTKRMTEEDILYWYTEWYEAMEDAERRYNNLTNTYCPAQLARSVLPNSLKTEINCKYNLREWRHFFKMRCDTPAHPQMREITLPLLADFKSKIPIIFDDLNY